MMLPSTSNTRRTARLLPPIVADGTHNRSHSGARSSKLIPSPRGRRSLAIQLRWFLCGIALLYVVFLWHSRLWTTGASGGQTVVTSMRVATRSTTLSDKTLPTHWPAATEISRTPMDSGASTQSVAPMWTPAPQSANANAAPFASSSTPPSSNSVNIEWLRSLVLTTKSEPTNFPATSVPLSHEDYTARMHQLEGSRRALQTSIEMLKNQLATARTKLMDHATVIANEEAKDVRPLPSSASTPPRKFVCVGWRATADCGPRGSRVPRNDRACLDRVLPKSAGYCEIQDSLTQERFRVMETSCESLRWEAQMTCADAPYFANFPARTNERLSEQHQQSQQNAQNQQPTRGIVLVVYPKMLPSAYATLRTLRRFACTLNVELWYSPTELQNAATHPIISAMVTQYGPVTLRAIEDVSVRGFTTKIHAIRHSAFDHVLFLDADNVPVKDPTYLFELPQFKSTGAIFWPDFWHPDHTIFAVHARSLLWEYLDLPFVDMFEQESGQLVIDKIRSHKALALLDLYGTHRPNLLDKFKLVHGDKDLFRLAWLKSNTSFHMVAQPPAVAGNVVEDMFCGQTMAQFDPQGGLLFLHRNAQKLLGRHAKKRSSLEFHGLFRVEEGPGDQETEVDPEIWTHLLQFKPTSTRADYTIEIFKGSPAFPPGQWCYGKPSLSTPHFDAFKFADMDVRTLENEIRAYAVEATDLVRDAKHKELPEPTTI